MPRPTEPDPDAVHALPESSLSSSGFLLIGLSLLLYIFCGRISSSVAGAEGRVSGLACVFSRDPDGSSRPNGFRTMIHIFRSRGGAVAVSVGIVGAAANIKTCAGAAADFAGTVADVVASADLVSAEMV